MGSKGFIDNRPKKPTKIWPSLEETHAQSHANEEGHPMTDSDTTPLGHTMKAVADIGMKPHEVSAIANVTTGLGALANTNAPVPLALIAQWRGQLDEIERARRLPARHKYNI